MAKALQYGQAAFSARISTAGAADVRASDKPSRCDIVDAVISNPLVQKIRQVTGAWLLGRKGARQLGCGVDGIAGSKCLFRQDRGLRLAARGENSL